MPEQQAAGQAREFDPSKGRLVNGTQPVVGAVGALPVQRLDRIGRPQVDLHGVLSLALPLVANSAMLIVLNLTDVWFVGRISTNALAAVSAVQWPVIVVTMLLGGVALAVQPAVAQAYGARRFTRAALAVVTGLWGLLLVVPLFIGAGAAGATLLQPLGLPSEVASLAAAYWYPRVAGAASGAGVWAVVGFFNGIGRVRVSVLITAAMAVANAALNQIFIFRFGWGIAGSAWATTAAQLLGLGLGLAAFLQPQCRRQYHTDLVWKPRLHSLLGQWRLGIPIGVLYAADLIGVSVFQAMQVRLSAADGAATQIVMMLTSLAYMPGVGIALAGTTLVGQSIGAGDRAWARRVGNFVIGLTALYMGGVGLLLAALGPTLLPLFVGAHDAQSMAVVDVGVRIIWLAAAYQVFDGLNLGSAYCLRGAGDASVPAALVLVPMVLVLVPLAHVLTFSASQGWVQSLPALGWGAPGGWLAMLVYIMLIGGLLWGRWRSAEWTQIRI